MIFAYDFKRFIVVVFVVVYCSRKNNVKCLEDFSRKAPSISALSAAPGKSVIKAKRGCGSLRTSTVFGNLA